VGIKFRIQDSGFRIRGHRGKGLRLRVWERVLGF
jgi:hypothetical protein